MQRSRFKDRSRVLAGALAGLSKWTGARCTAALALAVKS